MPAAATMGHQARMSMAATGTAIGSYTEAIEFVSESVIDRKTIVDSPGVRGTRSVAVERARNGNENIGGTIRCLASPAMLVNMLPRILGAAAAGTTFALAETLPSFDLLIDRGTRRFTYGGCVVSRATFGASAGGQLMLDLDVIGKTEAVSATAFPTITIPVDPPYLFSDCTGAIVWSGTAYQSISATIVIDNGVVARFVNSLTATDIHPTDRIITVGLQTPYTTDETGLYGIGVTGAASTITFTDAGYSLAFAFANLAFEDQSPVVTGKGETVLQLNGRARKSGSTNELIVTNDSTP